MTTRSDAVPPTDDTRLRRADARDSDPVAPRPAGDLGWAVLALITSLAGLGASIALIGEKLQILENPLHTTACDISAVLSCGTVIRSEQASLFGFPNPFIGLVAYAVVIVIAVAVLAGARFRRWFWWGLVIGQALGQIFLLWLWLEATFDINALCLYCMIVWLVHPFLLMATIGRCVRAGAIPAGPGLRSSAGLWSIGLAVLIVLIVFGSVLVRFAGTMIG
ncbi:vitamin K epoxide reductase family protein [Kocuria palustris]|uniref:vitamin K epoxide reductase family protein n=1 Tax=Kocuria palustris TaxID=71999 RepID=UPI00119DF713|nr:vitamin K epoxide reductase family protein [Kocuria palustris]